MFGCTADRDEPQLEDSSQFDKINYTFDNETIVVTYSVDEANDELIPIDNNASVLLDEIFNSNETLISHFLDENNVILFRNDSEMEEYFRSINQPLNTSTKSLSDELLTSRDGFFLNLYYDCCYDDRGRFDWISACDVEGCGDGLKTERLKNFNNTNAWSSLSTYPGCGPSRCYKYDQPYPGTNPNDRTNSVLVYNVFARFYEDSNYRGRSIVLDGRNGRQRGFRKLRKVRYRGKWSNRISSVKLTF